MNLKDDEVKKKDFDSRSRELDIKNQRKHYLKRNRLRNINDELSLKLPNEFREALTDYNHRNNDDFCLVDYNQYS